MKMTKAWVLIVEDHQEVAQVLFSICQAAFPHCHIEIAPSFRKGSELLDKLKNTLDINLVLALIDIGLPDGIGTDLIRKISAQHSQTIAIVTTIFDDDQHLLDALRAGASGYLLKGHSPDELARYFSEALTGIPALSPSIARSVLTFIKSKDFHPTQNTFATEAELELLTPREIEILQIVSRGYSSKEAGKLLAISSNTICVHIKSIYKKLGINNRAEAVLAAQKLNYRG